MIKTYEIRIIRKIIKNKNENIRAMDKKNKEIAKILDVHHKVVSKWIIIFFRAKNTRSL